MPAESNLADRLREIFDGDAEEKKMFGGLAFMVNGHMTVAASGRDVLMVRVDPDDMAELTAEDGVEPMVMKGNQLKGWLDVQPPQIKGDDDLRRWVDIARAFVATLPPK